MRFTTAVFGLLFIVFSTTSCSKKQIVHNPNQVVYQNVYNEFRPLWNLYQQDSRGGWPNNDEGRFSNDDATVIEGLIYLYKKTNDEIYLERCFEVSDRLISNDDVSRGVVDKYRNNHVLPGWSSTRYTADNSRHAFDLDEALILYPLVRLYRVVKETNNVHVAQKYKEKALNLLKRATTEFDTLFLPDWVQVNETSGFFYDPYFKDVKVNMPLNQLSIVGQLCLDLYIATKQEKYKSFASQTATYLKSNFKVKDNAYQWTYNLPLDSLDHRPYEIDDVGHGSWVTYFALNCFEQGIIFNQQDVVYFTNMFVKIAKGVNSFAHYVDGSGISDQPLIVQYYVLAPYKLEIKNILDSYYKSRTLVFLPNSILNHVGYHHILYFGMKVYYNDGI